MPQKLPIDPTLRKRYCNGPSRHFICKLQGANTLNEIPDVARVSGSAGAGGVRVEVQTEGGHSTVDQQVCAGYVG